MVVVSLENFPTKNGGVANISFQILVGDKVISVPYLHFNGEIVTSNTYKYFTIEPHTFDAPYTQYSFSMAGLEKAAEINYTASQLFAILDNLIQILEDEGYPRHGWCDYIGTITQMA